MIGYQMYDFVSAALLKRKERALRLGMPAPTVRKTFQRDYKVNEISEFINANCKTVKGLLIYS